MKPDGKAGSKEADKNIVVCLRCKARARLSACVACPQPHCPLRPLAFAALRALGEEADRLVTRMLEDADRLALEGDGETKNSPSTP